MNVATVSIAPSNTSMTELAAAAQRATPFKRVFLMGINILVVVETGFVIAIVCSLYN